MRNVCGVAGDIVSAASGAECSLFGVGRQLHAFAAEQVSMSGIRGGL